MQLDTVNIQKYFWQTNWMLKIFTIPFRSAKPVMVHADHLLFGFTIIRFGGRGGGSLETF